MTFLYGLATYLYGVVTCYRATTTYIYGVNLTLDFVKMESRDFVVKED